ncbi:MAG: hypothetical protein K6F63_00615 [Lachnospiraceae bacterium]|nr:hypothetical protein [Lachnospiraceae bacterium]
MREKAVFRIIYGILLAALILMTDYAVVYVQENIDEYEASQPDHVVDEVTEKFGAAVKEGRAAEVLTLPQLEVSPYEGDLYADYYEKLSSVSEWNWKILSGSYSETHQIYGLYGDGELLAKLTLKCNDSRIIMEILTANTWEAGEIYPAVTLTRYTEVIDVPEGFTAQLDGKPVEKGSEGVEWTEKDGHIIYTIANLYNLKDVKVFDQFGRECKTTNDNGYVTANATFYNLILPEHYKVTDEGHEIKGKVEEAGIHYIYASASEKLTIEDGYGNSVEFKNGDKPVAIDVSFCVPDNFTVSWGKNKISDFETGRKALDKYKDYVTFTKMPELVRYEIKGMLKLPELQILDNLGQPVKYTFTDNYFEIQEQTAMEEVPEEVLAEADPIESAKMWSLFLSNDLSGSRHGFGTIKNYLVPGTYLYQNAEAFGKSIDITFASSHEEPVFVAEKVSNYIRYGENLFSCDIYLNKEMYLTTNYEKGNVYDEINSTFFFCKYNGEWRIAGQLAKVED